MNDVQALHGIAIDDAYRVEHVLADGPRGRVELVMLGEAGPFVRRKIPVEKVDRTVWAQLATCGCPYLPQLVATYELPDRFATVCTFVPGKSLAREVAEHGHLDSVRATSLVSNICEAVASLHARGVIHRDLAPGNIIVADDGAHVVDLGSARMANAPTCKEDAQGTWGFAAPEQYGFAAADMRSDIYGIGCLLGYMLTGITPGGDAYEQALASPTRVPDALRAVVARACAFEPSDRYQTVEELYRAITSTISATSDALCEQAPSTAVGSRAHSLGASAQSASVPISSVAGSGAAPSACPGDSTRASSMASAPGVRPLARRAGRVVVVGVAMVLIAVCGGVAALVLGNAGDGEAQRAESQDVEGDDAGQTSYDAGTDLESDSSDGAGDSSVVEPGDAADADGAVRIVESGWSVDDNGYVSYGLVIENTSDELAVEFPTYTITGRDEDGTVLFADEQTLFNINPGQTIYWADFAGNGRAPATVEFDVRPPESYNVHRVEPIPDPFVVVNASSGTDPYGGVVISGEFAFAEGADSSQLDSLSSQVAVSVVLRDESGKIVGGTTDFFDIPREGESIPFSVTLYNCGDPASFDVYAQPW